jgi:hypothetical protein
MSTAIAAGNDVETLRALAARYGQAWNDHDLDAIMSMHAPGMAFHLHVDGFQEAGTPDAVRAQFAFFFEAIPDLHFETARLAISEGLIVHEFSAISGTLAGPFPVGGSVATPDGRHMRFEGVDVLPCEGGLVKRKDTYLDGVSFTSQLSLQARQPDRQSSDGLDS